MYRGRAYLASLLSLVLVLACAAPALGVSASDVRKHDAAAAAARKKAAEQEKLAAKLKDETARLDDLVDDLQAQADALDPQISTATKRSDRLRREVQKLRSEIRVKEAQIKATQAEYKLEQGYFEDRVSASYRQGNYFYIQMLLSSADLGEFIKRTEFVARVFKSSNDLAESLVSTRESLQRAQTELDRSLEIASAKRKEALAAENKVRDLQDARQAKTDRQNGVLHQKAALMVESKKNAKRLRALADAEQRESDRIAARLSGGGSGKFHGSMTWPVPSTHRITSNFGPRICPFHGRELHPGIDIGASSGSPIVAAASGTVIEVRRSSSYGNMVMIDHGNGVVTLYAHQRTGGIKVGNGQHVTKGQRIGTVGSTGYSTGPHLHFEVRVNGTPKNPLNYTR